MEIFGYLNDIYKFYALFVLIYTRVIGCLYTVTLFRREVVTLRIILSLSLLLSYIIFTNMLAAGFNKEIDSSYYLMMVIQFVIGMSIGLMLNFIFEAFHIAGQFISTQIGLSIASLMDPRMGFVTPLTEFYYIVISIAFLTMNGHLLLIKLLAKSFEALPLESIKITNLLTSCMSLSHTMFILALTISAVILISIMATNITLAVLSKFAPQLNIFSIGINIQLILGLLIVYITFYQLLDIADISLTKYLNLFYHSVIGVDYVR